MTTPLPDSGWFLDPNDPTRERWWNGTSWTDQYRPASASTTATAPATARSWRPTGITILAAAVALVVAIIASVTSGFGGFLVVAGLFGVVAAVWTLATKKPGWLNLNGQNPAAKIVVGVSAAALILGAIVLPHPTNASADNATAQSLISTAAATPTKSPTPSPTPTRKPTATPTPTPVKTPLAGVSGQSADAAETALKAAGYTVTKTAADGSTPSDWTGWTVAEQRPAAGTPVQSGSTVVLVFAPPPAPAPAPVAPAEPAPAPAPDPEPAPAEEPAPAPEPAPAEAYYPNCAAARAAGVTPIHAGEPGYSSKLDRDGDGIACE